MRNFNNSKFTSSLSNSHFDKGLLLARSNFLPQAIEEFTQAISLNPLFVEAYVNRGFTYALLKKHDFAIQDYDIALSIDPNLSEAYHNRGLSLEQQGKIHDSFADFQKAIALNPNYLKALIALGRTQINLQMNSSAIQTLGHVLTRDSHSGIAYYLRGRAYANLDKKQEAFADLKTALDMEISDILKIQIKQLLEILLQ